MRLIVGKYGIRYQTPSEQIVSFGRNFLKLLLKVHVGADRSGPRSRCRALSCSKCKMQTFFCLLSAVLTKNGIMLLEVVICGKRVAQQLFT